jgi:hypothetical protein
MKLKHYALVAVMSITWMAMILVPPWIFVCDSGTQGNGPEICGFGGYALFCAPPEDHYKGGIYLPMIDWSRLWLQLFLASCGELLFWALVTRPRPILFADERVETPSLPLQRTCKIVTLVSLLVIAFAVKDDVSTRLYFLTRTEPPTAALPVVCMSREAAAGTVLTRDMVIGVYGSGVFNDARICRYKENVVGRRLKTALKAGDYLHTDNLIAVDN